LREPAGFPYGQSAESRCIFPLVGWDSEIETLEAVPTQVGNGWRILIQWASGRTQYINGFESLQDAEDWISNEAHRWLRAQENSL
jgi:hypothetical protein